MKNDRPDPIEKMSALKLAYRAIAARYPFVRTVYQSTIVPILSGTRAIRDFPIRDRAVGIVDRLRLWAAAELPLGAGIGNRAEGREIVMLVVSDLRIDPRVEREARALAEAGYHVRVICPDPTQGSDPDLRLDWGNGIEISFLHWTAASFVMDYPGFRGIGLFKEAIRYRPFAFHAHDLNASYAALAAARVTGAHLVVDFHEWVSENVHWDRRHLQWRPYRGVWKRKLQRLEKKLLREASRTITVCNSIANAMASELGNGRRPDVVRNIPNFSAAPTREYLGLKAQFGLPEEAFVVLYQGGTGPLRLLEPIIEALAFVPFCTLIIRGPSLEIFGERYREIARRAGAGDRLILASAVPSRDVVVAARGADAGIYSVVNLCRSFTLALPNKIFEYLAAGIPVLSAAYPEAGAIVLGHNVGITFAPTDPRSIGLAIEKLAFDKDFSDRCRANCTSALADLNAQDEWKKLVTIYNAISAGLPAVTTS